MIFNNQHKIILEPHEEKFIKDNFFKMTNPELANVLGLKLTKFKEFAYAMGLKRMEMQYWTTRQTQFLRDNYKETGDSELAEIFEIKWHKEKGWTKKHIEKKRRYLKLKRTSIQLKKIHSRNVLMGRFKMCSVNMWKTRGVTPEGEKRVWFHQYRNSPFVVIKTKTGFVHYNRWLWKQHNGPISKGMNVRVMSEDKINYTIKDLILITDAENAAMNSKNRIPKELQETVTIMNKINKLITQNNR